jgi:hypothetical protein
MKIRARTKTYIPATLTATGGLGVEKENGVWTISPDWDGLVLETSIPDPSDRELWTKKADEDEYTRLSVQYLIDNLPQGPAGEISIGTVTELNPGDAPTVTNSGTETEAVLDFGIPGSATITIGTTTTLPAGSNATVSNSGTSSDLVLDFGVPRGADASFKWLYEDSTSMAAPEEGGMRFNNADLSSVTAIAVNAKTADTGNPDQSDYIIKWDDSTSTPKAFVEIREEAGSSAVYQLSSVTDNSTWLQLNVTYVSGTISLTEGDALYFTPHLVGNKGADGAGVGDVVGPNSSTTGNVAVFDDTDGKGIDDSGIAATDLLVSSNIGVSVQGYDADTTKNDVANTFSQKQTFANSVKVQQALEKVTITADNPAATTNFDWLTQAVQYYTTDNDTNWTLNVRGDSSNSLDSVMATGESITFSVIVTNGVTPFYQSAMTIDGNAVTPQWMGSPAPAAGTASKRDTYTHTIIKTASATFIVQSSFAAGY